MQQAADSAAFSAAVSQTKRMLAYSSIVQAGYILMAFVPFGDEPSRFCLIRRFLYSNRLERNPYRIG
jgi:NADH:ubiquinone oxidoreductase subunit 2 (subunit N)